MLMYLHESKCMNGRHQRAASAFLVTLFVSIMYILTSPVVCLVFAEATAIPSTTSQATPVPSSANSSDSSSSSPSSAFAGRMPIRLVNGLTLMDGRVEIKPIATEDWGTVCSNVFKENNAGAIAVCNSVGFPDTIDSYFESFGGGDRSAPIWLDDLNCTGALLIDNCTTPRPLADHSCTHGDDSGVRCVAKRAQWEFKLVNNNTRNRGEDKNNGNSSTAATRGVVMFRPFPQLPWGTVYAAPFAADTSAGLAMRRAVCNSLGFSGVKYPMVPTATDGFVAWSSSASEFDSVPQYLKLLSCPTSSSSSSVFLQNCTMDGYMQQYSWKNSGGGAAAANGGATPPPEALQIWCDDSFLLSDVDTLEVRLVNGYGSSNGQIQFREDNRSQWKYVASSALLRPSAALPSPLSVNGGLGDESDVSSMNIDALNAVCRQAGFPITAASSAVSGNSNALFRFFGAWPAKGVLAPSTITAIDCRGNATATLSQCELTRAGGSEFLSVPAGVDCYPSETASKRWDFRLFNPNLNTNSINNSPSMGIAQMRLLPDAPWGTITANETSNFGLWDAFCNSIVVNNVSVYSSKRGGTSRILRDLGRFTNGDYSYLGRYSDAFSPAYLSRVRCGGGRNPSIPASPPFCTAVCVTPSTTFQNSTSNDVDAGNMSSTSSPASSTLTTSTSSTAASTTNDNSSDCGDSGAIYVWQCIEGKTYADYLAQQANNAKPEGTRLDDCVRGALRGSSFGSYDSASVSASSAPLLSSLSIPSRALALDCDTGATMETARWEVRINGTSGLVEFRPNSRMDWGMICPSSSTTATLMTLCHKAGYTDADYVESVPNTAPLKPLNSYEGPRNYLYNLRCGASSSSSSGAADWGDCTFDHLEGGESCPTAYASVDCYATPDRPSGWQLRLVSNSSVVTDPTVGAGRVELLPIPNYSPSVVESKWGTICNDEKWSQAHTIAVCMSLGFNTTGRAVRPRTRSCGKFGCGTAKQSIWIDKAVCGQRPFDFFQNCSEYAWRWNDCTHSQDVAVECLPPIPNLEEFEYRGVQVDPANKPFYYRIEVRPMRRKRAKTVANITTGTFANSTASSDENNATAAPSANASSENASDTNSTLESNTTVSANETDDNDWEWDGPEFEWSTIRNTANYRTALLEALIACRTINVSTPYAESLAAGSIPAAYRAKADVKHIISNYACVSSLATPSTTTPALSNLSRPVTLHNCTPDVQTYYHPDLEGDHANDWVVDCRAVYADPPQWQLRLVGAGGGATSGSNVSRISGGRLEVKPLPFAEWGTVCDDGWTAANSIAACQSLGFNYTERMAANASGTMFAVPPRRVDIALFAPQATSSSPIWLDDMTCPRRPFEYLQNCSAYTFKFHNCGHGEDIALKCENPIYDPEKFEFRFIQQKPAIPYTGRVEMRPDGNAPWGTIYQSVKTAEHVARAACLSVGFTDVHAWYATSVLQGAAGAPVYVMNYDCPTNATHLKNCSFDPALYETTASHSNDLTVECDYASDSNRNLWEFRLANSTSAGYGRLEMRAASWAQWGTISGNVWSADHSVAACRSLGFTEANGFNPDNAQYTTATPSSPSSSVVMTPAATARVWMHYTFCSARPFIFFQNCSQYSWRYNVDDHSKDVWLDCLPRIQARIVDGPASEAYRGRLEVKYNNWTTDARNGWGTVCNDDFIRNHFSWLAACRTAGFNTTAAAYEEWGAGTGAINMDDAWCTSASSTLNDCSYRRLGTHNCAHSEDAGVNCFPPPEQRGEWEFRFAGTGSSRTGGRIEMRPSKDAAWGMICPRTFNHSYDAWIAACRTMGVETIRARPRYYGPGYGPIYLDNMTCPTSPLGQNTNATLRDCSFYPLGSYDCTPMEAAGVDCDPPMEAPEQWEYRLDGSTLKVPNALGILPFGYRSNASDPNNATYTAGTINVRFSGSEKWGAICNNGLTLAQSQRIAAIACKSVGIYNASRPPILYQSISHPANPFNAKEWMPIVLSNLNCPIGSQSLSDCYSDLIYSHQCTHQQDIHVDCLPTMDQSPLPAPEPSAPVRTCSINFSFTTDLPVNDKAMRGGRDVTINITLPDYLLDAAGNKMLSRYEFRDLFGTATAATTVATDSDDANTAVVVGNDKGTNGTSTSTPTQQQQSYFPDNGPSALAAYINIYDSNIGTNEPNGFRYTYGPNGQAPSVVDYSRPYNGRVYCEIVLRRVVRCTIPHNPLYALAAEDIITVEVLPELTVDWVYPSCTNRPIIPLTTTPAPTFVYSTTPAKTDAPTTTGPIVTMPPPTVASTTAAATTEAKAGRGFEVASFVSDGDGYTASGSIGNTDGIDFNEVGRSTMDTAHRRSSFSTAAIVNTNGYSSGGSHSVFFQFKINADQTSPFASVVDAFGPIVGIVAVFAAAIGGSSPTDMQVIALLTQSFCMAEVDRRSTSMLSYFISPLFDFGYAAIAFGNLGFLLLFTALQYAFAERLIRTRRLKWIDGWGAVRFPSYSYAITQLSFLGVCYGSLFLINGYPVVSAKYNDDPPAAGLSYFLGAVGIIAMALIIASIVYVSLFIVVAKFVHYTQFLSRPWYYRWLYPLGFWENENQRIAFGYMLSPYREGELLKLFSISTFVTSFITAFIMIMDFIPCLARFIVVGVVFCILAIMFIILSPSRCPPQTLLSIISNLVLAILAFMSAAAYENPTVALMNAKLAFSFIQILLTIVRSLYAIGVRVMEQRTWRRFRTKDMHEFAGDEELQSQTGGKGRGGGGLGANGNDSMIAKPLGVGERFEDDDKAVLLIDGGDSGRSDADEEEDTKKNKASQHPALLQKEDGRNSPGAAKKGSRKKPRSSDDGESLLMTSSSDDGFDDDDGDEGPQSNLQTKRVETPPFTDSDDDDGNGSGRKSAPPPLPPTSKKRSSSDDGFDDVFNSDDDDNIPKSASKHHRQQLPRNSSDSSSDFDDSNGDNRMKRENTCTPPSQPTKSPNDGFGTDDEDFL